MMKRAHLICMLGVWTATTVSLTFPGIAGNVGSSSKGEEEGQEQQTKTPVTALPHRPPPPARHTQSNKKLKMTVLEEYDPSQTSSSLASLQAALPDTKEELDTSEGWVEVPFSPPLTPTSSLKYIPNSPPQSFPSTSVVIPSSPPSIEDDLSEQQLALFLSEMGAFNFDDVTQTASHTSLLSSSCTLSAPPPWPPKWQAMQNFFLSVLPRIQENPELQDAVETLLKHTPPTKPSLEFDFCCRVTQLNPMINQALINASPETAREYRALSGRLFQGVCTTLLNQRPQDQTIFSFVSTDETLPEESLTLSSLQLVFDWMRENATTLSGFRLSGENLINLYHKAYPLVPIGAFQSLLDNNMNALREETLKRTRSSSRSHQQN